MSSSTVPVEGPIYVTKYAVSRGIVVFARGWVYTSEMGGPRYFKDKETGLGLFLPERDWTLDEQEAKERCREQLRKALRACRAKTAKLNKLLEGLR